MTFRPAYPFPCRDCGNPIASEAERYMTTRRCRPCGLATCRETMDRVRARRRGEDVPLRKSGPPATTYPFPCKGCGELVHSKAERGQMWHLCKPCLREEQRAKKMRVRYGLSRDEASELHTTQDGVCAICDAPPTGGAVLVVDHDHATGRVRGLLCPLCNWMLGHAKDDPARLRAGADYLERDR